MATEFSKLQNKIEAGRRIELDEASWLFKQASNKELSQLASSVRKRFHPENEATYLIMSIINYTNVCVAMCDYCSFYRLPHQSGTYVRNFEQIANQIEHLISLGGRMVGFNGGFHPKLRIQDYANLFRQIREQFGTKIEFYGMTVAEFMFTAKLSKISYEDAADILKSNGSNWITGGGAEILCDSFRTRHSPGKYKVDDYFEAQSAILRAGLGSTATMVIGFDESLDERLYHLEQLRKFQDEHTSNPLTSFLCWTYKPYHNALGGSEIGIDEYLRWIAICRIYLDNFKHIRTSVLTKNDDALLALTYGANDFDLPTEDEVTQKAGATISLDFDAILSGARELGFTPKLRDPFPIQSQSILTESLNPVRHSSLLGV